MIDPRLLRTFSVVCDSGSITAAARVLNISQPSVSNAIATLEVRLGVRLFDRSRSGVSLTAEGEALRVRGQMLDFALRDVDKTVSLAARRIAGPLRVGGTPGALVSLLPQALKQIEGSEGRLSLHVVEKSERELAAMLQTGEIELAFITTEMETPPVDIVELTFSRDPFSLIVGPENGHLPDTIRLRRVADLGWVLPDAQGAFRRQVDALFIAEGLSAPWDVVRCDSLLTTKDIVRNGKRLTILPQHVAAAELAIGALRAITLEGTSFVRSVGVRYHRDKPLTPLAREILEVMERIFHSPEL